MGGMGRFMFFWGVLVVGLGLLGGCEDEPNVMNDSMTETLFVWGYSDVNTGMHRVRIRRAILEEGDMYVHAQDPGLLLPVDPLDVRIVVHGHEENEECMMNPVVYPKDPGVFSSEENIIHEAYQPFNPGELVRLVITNLNTGEITSSEFASCTAGPFLYPVKIGWYEPTYSFTSAAAPFHIEIREMRTEVQKFVIELKYVDVLQSGQEICQKSVFEGGDHFAMSNGGWKRPFPVEYLFNILRMKIPEPDPEVRYRSFYRFNFRSYAASQSLREFLDNGIRFTDNRRFYFSNITNGYGLFYATHWVETGDIQPTSAWTDTLFSDESLKNLKFSRYIYNGIYTDPDSTNLKIW